MVPSSPPSGAFEPGKDRPPADRPGTDRRAERLVVAGGGAFLLGLMSLGLALALYARDGQAPGWIAGAALLSPIGFAISFLGLVVQVNRRRRE